MMEVQRSIVTMVSSTDVLKTLFIPLLLSFAINLIDQRSGHAEERLRCPGQNTLEMQQCAARNRDDAKLALAARMSTPLLQQWVQTTDDVCQMAYAGYRDGSIYGQLVIGCEASLHRALLNQFKGLNESPNE